MSTVSRVPEEAVKLIGLCAALAMEPAPVAQEIAVRTLRVVDLATGRPLSGVSATRALARARETLLAELQGDWKARIGESAARWLSLAREEAVPATPTGEEPAFVPRDETPIGRTADDGLLVLSWPAGEGRIVLRAHGHVPVSLVIPPALDPAPIDVPLPAEGTLRIQLVDQEGAAVPDGFVRVERGFEPFALGKLGAEPLFDELRWHGPTDEAGELVLAGLPAGVELDVVPFGEFRGEPQMLVLDPATRAGACRLQVRELGSLRGTVLDPDENPVPNFAVVLADSGYRTQQARTDDWGRFSFDAAVAGVGTLELGNALGMGGIGARETLAVEIRAHETVSLDPYFLPRLTKITGRVTWTGAFDPSVLYVDLRHRGESAYWAWLEADGSFVLEAPRGDYSLALQNSAYAPVQNPILVRRVSAPAEGLVLPIDGRVGAIEFRFEKPPAEGTTLGARVRRTDIEHDRLLDTFGELPFADVPVHDGRVVCAPFLPGTYAVSLQLSDGGVAWLPEIRVEAGATTRMDHVSTEPSTLRPAVVDETGAAVPEAELVLVGLDGRESQDPSEGRRVFRTDAQGRVEPLAVPAGRWTAYASALDGRVSAPAELRLIAGEKQALELRLQAPSWIHGRVWLDGDPAAGIEMQAAYGTIPAVKLDIGGRWRVRTDAGGDYELGPFLPGAYRVSALANGRPRNRIELAPGRSAQDFHVSRASTTVRLLAEGQPLKGVRGVQVFSLERSRPDVRTAGSLVSVGAARFAGELPAGRLLVDATVSGSGPDAELCWVLAAGPPARELDLALPEGSLSVDIPADRENEPRPDLRLVELSGAKMAELDSFSDWKLPRREEGGKLTFSCIPPGARLEFTGFDREGRRFARAIRHDTAEKDAADGMSLEWP